MLRSLPAGNRVAGHHERDDPGRVLVRGALVGVRGLVDLAPSTALSIESSPNQRRPALSPAIFKNTAPIILMSDFLLGKTCTTRLRRLISRLARSYTLLVRSLTWCS